MRRCRRESLEGRSGPLSRSLQRGRAVEPERDVEALHALARRALHEVVQRRGDDSLLPLRGDVDETQVRVARQLGGRRVVDHPRERLARIELSICVLQLFERAFQVEIAGGEDAPGHRDQVWYERDLDLPVPAELAQLLRHLGQVAMTADRVRAQRLVDLAAVHFDAMRPHGPAGARLGFAHECGRGKAGRDRFRGGRQVGRQRGRAVAWHRSALQRGQRVGGRVRDRRSSPPARADAGAGQAQPERGDPGHVRTTPDPDDPGHPRHLLFRPERLSRRAAKRISRVLCGPAVHAGGRPHADHQAGEPHEPVSRQRRRAGEEGCRHRGAGQPHEGRVGPGRGVLQHRVRVRPHDRAGGTGSMALTYPRGFRAGTAACGIKAFTSGASAIPTGQKDDLCVIHSALLCDTGGVFTTNKIKSASVVIDQLHLQHNRVQALTITSGNANACTGAQGFKDSLQIAKLSARRLDLDPAQAPVSPTGVIGRYLPMDAMKPGIAKACSKLSTEGGAAAARAILTTDLVPKTATAELELAGKTIRLGGMCKGSGMIHPNMATMLAYITTDAAVEPGLMGKLVKSIADRSFNQVTVDGDSSTNDTFLILANGAAGNEPIRSGSLEAEQLEMALLEAARQLARAIARDGEGATTVS